MWSFIATHVEVIDIITDEIYEVEQLNDVRYDAQLIVYNDKLICILRKEKSKLWQIFDEKTNKWISYESTCDYDGLVFTKREFI